MQDNDATPVITKKSRPANAITPERALYHEEAARIRIKYNNLGRAWPPCPAQLSAEAREFRALDEFIASLTPTVERVVFDTKPPVGCVLKYLPGYNSK